MRKIIALSAGFFVAQSSSSHASCLERVQSFAIAICGEISNVGSQIRVDGSGSFEAGTNQVIKKFVGGASGKLSGRATADTYENVVRDQLKDEHIDARQCRQNMVRLAAEKECSGGESSFDTGSSSPGTLTLRPPDEFALKRGGHIFLTEQRILFVLTGYTGVSQDRGQGIFITIGGQPTIMYPGLDNKVPLHIGPCRLSLISAVVNGSTSFQTDCSIYPS